jgi:hypothetical protein
MKKHRIYWPLGNPKTDAWEVECKAGCLVVRRNHPLIRQGSTNCQGWDVWLNGNYLGAIGSLSLTELAQLSSQRLKTAALAACCGRHADFSPITKKSHSGWGGRRANSGRRFKAAERRVKLDTSVDPSTLKFIDQHRGIASRGEYIDMLVQGQLGD